MNRTFGRTAAAGALCLGLAASSFAFAQPPGPPQPGARDAARQRLAEDFRHRREQRLHDLLQIKPEQEGAFRAFLAGVESLRPPGPRGPGASGAPRGPGERQALTTPERLDRMGQRMAERQQRFQRYAAAVKTFYAALTPEQRKAFDALGPMGGRGGHGRFGGRGPGGR